MTELAAARGRIRREPQRFVRPHQRTAFDPGLVAPHADFGAFEPDVRAVAEAGDGTCRFVFESVGSFRFCGAPGTVTIAGERSYCAACFDAMRDKAVRRESTDVEKIILHRHRYRPSRLLCDPIGVDLALADFDAPEVES